MLGTIFTGACGTLKGEFGFKTPRDDFYRKWNGRYEFDSSMEVKWVYRFHSIPSRGRVGVIYLKKEVVWMEIDTTVESIGPERQHVFGTIYNLPEGRYKIVLVNGDEENKVIDTLEFTVYNDEMIN